MVFGLIARFTILKREKINNGNKFEIRFNRINKKKDVEVKERMGLIEQIITKENPLKSSKRVHVQLEQKPGCAWK